MVAHGASGCKQNAKIEARKREAELNMEHAAVNLEKIVAHSLRQVPASDQPLAAWPLVCGSAVAGRTRALNFSAGILRVEVADAGWKVELQGLAPRYLAAINRYSSQAVERIEFVIASAVPGESSR